jgi:hypothetical protein
VLLWCLHTVNGQSGFLYQGGFLLVALATLAVLASVVAVPGSVTDRLFSLAPVRYVGRISYGVYLYHWPLFLVLDQGRTHLSGAALLGLRLAVTLAAAATSYHFVERPLRGLRPTAAWPRLVVLPAALLLVLAVLLAATWPTASSGGIDTGLAAATPVRATSAHPVTGLILGDSVMVEMSFGLTYQDERWGVNLIPKAVLNCDLFSGTQIMEGGSARPQAEGCPDWRRTWASEVAEFDPDTVLIGVGRWELADRFYEGRWRSPQDPVVRQATARLLNDAVAVVSSHGAHVVLATALCTNPDLVGQNGLPDPMDSLSRVEAYNRLVYQVAAEHPGLVSVLDIDKLLCPGERWTPTMHGILVRDPDGIHPSPAGGQYIRPEALPLLARSGLPHLEARLAAASKAPKPATAKTAGSGHGGH